MKSALTIWTALALMFALGCGWSVERSTLGDPDEPVEVDDSEHPPGGSLAQCAEDAVTNEDLNRCVAAYAVGERVVLLANCGATYPYCQFTMPDPPLPPTYTECINAAKDALYGDQFCCDSCWFLTEAQIEMCNYDVQIVHDVWVRINCNPLQ